MPFFVATLEVSSHKHPDIAADRDGQGNINGLNPDPVHSPNLVNLTAVFSDICLLERQPLCFHNQGYCLL